MSKTAIWFGVLLGAVCVLGLAPLAGAGPRPNIVLMMADDLGWGDVGFNGNTIIKTPHLDQLAAKGSIQRHFYAGAPVCSPTRATFLTGRHNWRVGIWSANVGHLPREEITIPELLKEKGYRTGHFGKWHLGTLDKSISSKGAKRKPEVNFSPPAHHGYDRSFVTESAVATWDPGYGGRAENNAFYDDGKPTMENVKGGAARVIMDRVIPFIDDAAAADTPFLAVIWFHAPHQPVVAGPEYLALYPDAGESAHYYGCITEMDDQVGRLQARLGELGILDQTLQFFCSDNGPEGKEAKPGSKKAGVTGGLRGRKRSLYEGGVRGPALAVWPGTIPAGSVVEVPGTTLDYLPTVAAIVGYDMPDARPIDGQDILPILAGKADRRAKSIPFRHGSKATLVRGTFKLVVSGSLEDTGKEELYDLSGDWGEERNIAGREPDQVSAMKQEIAAFLRSAEASHAGRDYPDSDFKPVGAWNGLAGAARGQRGSAAGRK